MKCVGVSYLLLFQLQQTVAEAFCVFIGLFVKIIKFDYQLPIVCLLTLLPFLSSFDGLFLLILDVFCSELHRFVKFGLEGDGSFLCSQLLLVFRFLNLDCHRVPFEELV